MHYPDLENLGPISSYNLTSLKKSITSLTCNDFTSEDSIIAKFYDRYTTLVVQFDLKGNFKKLVYQDISVPMYSKVLFKLKKFVQQNFPFCH